MFDRLKKSLSKDAPPPVLSGPPRVHDEMVAWGLAQGLNDAAPKDGKGFCHDRHNQQQAVDP